MTKFDADKITAKIKEARDNHTGNGIATRACTAISRGAIRDAIKECNANEAKGGMPTYEPLRDQRGSIHRNDLGFHLRKKRTAS
jgi:hypothetical protein